MQLGSFSTGCYVQTVSYMLAKSFAQKAHSNSREREINCSKNCNSKSPWWQSSHLPLWLNGFPSRQPIFCWQKISPHTLLCRACKYDNLARNFQTPGVCPSSARRFSELSDIIWVTWVWGVGNTNFQISSDQTRLYSYIYPEIEIKTPKCWNQVLFKMFNIQN
jgi:hypothetical protein